MYWFLDRPATGLLQPMPRTSSSPSMHPPSTPIGAGPSTPSSTATTPPATSPSTPIAPQQPRGSSASITGGSSSTHRQLENELQQQEEEPALHTNDCPYCPEEWNDEAEGIRLECGHWFHANCLAHWVNAWQEHPDEIHPLTTTSVVCVAN